MDTRRAHDRNPAGEEARGSVRTHVSFSRNSVLHALLRGKWPPRGPVLCLPPPTRTGTAVGGNALQEVAEGHRGLRRREQQRKGKFLYCSGPVSSC